MALPLTPASPPLIVPIVPHVTASIRQQALAAAAANSVRYICWRRMRTWIRFVVVASLLALPACSGGSSTPAPSPTPGPGGNTATITITAAGVNPRTVTVLQGTQVTFVNNDSRSHLMASNPHPEHTDCPDMNQVGFLATGQSRQTGNLNIVRTCGFHDHDLPGVTALQGEIMIVPR